MLLVLQKIKVKVFWIRLLKRLHFIIIKAKFDHSRLIWKLDIFLLHLVNLTAIDVPFAELNSFRL